jgi:hypothetical protein
MYRRTLIRSLITWISLNAGRLRAQSAGFPGKHEATLKELAAIVLPESLSRPATDAVALQFVRWVQEYRSGAEMQTGYGTTRVRYKPASPAPGYLGQLEKLSVGALAAADLTSRRRKIAESLQAEGVRDLPMSPNGGHVAADLMTFYFQSPAANDLVYQAAIGKDQCRTLKNSGDVPAGLKNGPSHAAL